MLSELSFYMTHIWHIYRKKIPLRFLRQPKDEVTQWLIAFSLLHKELGQLKMSGLQRSHRVKGMCWELQRRCTVWCTGCISHRTLAQGLHLAALRSWPGGLPVLPSRCRLLGRMAPAHSHSVTGSGSTHALFLSHLLIIWNAIWNT